MAQLIPPIRPTTRRRRQRYMSTSASGLVALLLDAMNRFGPQVPLTNEADNAVSQAFEAIIFGKAPEHLHLFVWDGFDSVDWPRFNDPGRRGDWGLSKLRFAHLLAVGMAGLPPLGFDGVDEPEPLPFGRVISMILLVEPEMSKLLKIRNGKEGRSIVTTTRPFEMEYNDFYRVEVERINALPPDELFDLAFPYDEYD